MSSEVLLPSLALGGAIAIDVAIVTISKFHDDAVRFGNWVVPITITHTLFPAIGFIAFLFIPRAIPATELWLGIIGFLLVLLLVYEIFCESIGKTPIISITDWVYRGLRRAFSFCSPSSTRQFIGVLAVSCDAPLVGPALAAEGGSGDWSGLDATLAIGTIGLTVFFATFACFQLAKWMRQVDFKNTLMLTYFRLFGTYFELTIIGSFGIMSLLHGLSGNNYPLEAVSISSFVCLLYYVQFFPEFGQHEKSEADRAIHQ